MLVCLRDGESKEGIDIALVFLFVNSRRLNRCQASDFFHRLLPLLVLIKIACIRLLTKLSAKGQLRTHLLVFCVFHV
jgi:hypothetical protein